MPRKPEDMDLRTEVRAVIEEVLREGKPAEASWLTHNIVERHRSILGDDTDWYRACAYGHVRALVRLELGRYKASDDTERDEQLVLPGFTYVQRAYLVRRDDEQMLVRIEQCTLDELWAKIADLRAMAAGCIDHARELERYIREYRRGSKRR
jgi:hypothetical protein